MNSSSENYFSLHVKSARVRLGVLDKPELAALTLFLSLPAALPQVVLAIDTSSSLRDRLDKVKEKLHQLLHEQLCHKQAFTVLQFSSKVTAWREHLVPPSGQNLEDVWQWVEGLQADGSTSTLDALTEALGVRGAEAVYLLTDGRPNQPSDSILARVQELPSLPVHTISFNCADSRANYFLARLASNTGGRWAPGGLTYAVVITSLS